MRGLQRGDVVVAPFVWADNTCAYCSEALQTSRPHGGQWGLDGVDGGQGHAANLNVGNTRAQLVAVLTGLLPFTGCYPRTLNALAAVNTGTTPPRQENDA